MSATIHSRRRLVKGIEIISTSRSSAVTSDFVVREGQLSRLVFRPELVDNPNDPAACVKGTFIYQRKGKSEVWTDAKEASLSHLKKGEGYQLQLASGELLPLLRHLRLLYQYQRRQGITFGHQRLVRIEDNLARLLELGQADLHAFLDAHSDEAVGTLRRVLQWLSSSSALAGLIETDGNQIGVMNAILGVAALRLIRRTWERNATNPSEEFWQDTLSQHAFVLSQLFAYPIVVIAGKAYVGGKRINNLHGSIVDFLARSESTSNAVLIEIKTPSTPLLAKEYRDGVFPPSGELSGAIAQALKYRDVLMENARSLFEGTDQPVLLSEPRCAIVIGDSAQLTDPTRRMGFERFRERINGVTVVTFDELFQRVSRLEELLAPPESEPET